MSTGVVFWGKGGQCVWPKTFPPLCANYLEILGAPTICSPKGFTFTFMYSIFYNESKCISLLISLSTSLSAETSSVVMM